MTRTSPLRRLLQAAALLALLAPLAAHAQRYRVDLIVFIDRNGGGGESMVPAEPPRLAHALEPFDTAKLRAAGIEVLPDEQFGLTEAWQRLRNSRMHQPILRLAWLQKEPPAERGVRLRLRHGQPWSELTTGGSTTTYPVDGTVALLVGRYLHLDADLAYTQAGNSGNLVSYRLQERRRLRREELHHLDSPRLGVLVRAQRAEAKVEAKPATKPAPKAAPKKNP